MPQMNCPLCGNKVTYHGLATLECAGARCRNYGGAAPVCGAHPMVGCVYRHAQHHAAKIKVIAVGVSRVTCEIANNPDPSRFFGGVPVGGLWRTHLVKRVFTDSPLRWIPE